MIFSHSQISQYVRCPKSYRYRYLEGWREKETRAAMAFGRCFEKALVSFFLGEDPTTMFFKEWAAFRDTPFDYKRGDSWDRLVHQGIHLRERFAQAGRIQVRLPDENLQVKMIRKLPGGDDFVAYIDAIGELDGKQCLIEWKTTTSCYPDEPNGLLALDPQLICYSWMSGIPDAAVIAFVRKSLSEIQYLKTSISEEQRREYGRLVETTVGQIESGCFHSHSGIRFPQNGCLSCPYVGLCLDRPELVALKLERKPGASSLDWLDELVD